MTQQADRKRYHTQRVLLILLMGSKCKYCQERRPWKLEFHHLVKPKWSAQNTSKHRRIRLYMRDWLNGECALACGTCNKKQGSPDDLDEVPF